MATKTKKKTVEQVQREKIEHLTKSVQDANAQIYKTDTAYRGLQLAVKNLFRFVKGATESNLIPEHLVRSDIFGRRDSMGDRSELSAEETIQAIMFDVMKLAKDFAREDEGTALLTEHIDDFKEIIGGLTKDEHRASTKHERLAIIAHNIGIAAKNGHGLNPDDPTQYMQGR